MTMTLWAAVLPCLTLLGSTLMSRGACTYSITPGSVTNAAAGATNSVAVGIVAGTGCSWTTANTNPWISILSGASGTGTGTVVCAVQANPNPVGRTGTVTIAGLTLTVRQQALVCAYTLSATSRAHGYSPATNSVDVTANGSGCNWKVTNNNSWITITSPTNNNGSGPVNYTVEVNAQPIPRTGVVMIANQSFTLSQAGVNCNYRLSPITRTHGHAAATNTVAVTSSNGCPWTVINTNTWVILLSPASGTGNATVTYRVTANGNVPDRSGVLTIAGQPFSLVQNGLGCTVSVTPNTRSHGYGTASNGLSVAVNAGCAWAASTTNSWITLVTGATGTGNGTVGYLVAANPSGLPRTGAVVVDDEVLALTQDGAPCVSYELSPDSRTHGHGAATNTVDLATLADCPWNVVNTNSWVTLRSPTSGTSNATVTYSVAANGTVNDRTGVIVIGGQPFNLTQLGAACTVPISPVNRNHSYGAASNTVTITATVGCAWTASTTNNWITFATAANGSGNGTVGYLVGANPSSIARTGTVVIADEILTLTQDGAPCTYAISPGSRMHGHGAATNTVSLSAPEGCPWSVVNTNGWITILSDATGTGDATVTYRVTANANPAGRAGLMVIGGQPFNLTQQGAACTVTIAPATRNHSNGAASNTVTISAGTGCGWVASTTNSWITLATAANGSGNGSVGYLVATNPSSLPRSGALVLADEVLVLTQDGTPCSFSILPGDRTHGYAATTNTVSLTAPQGCVWTVSNTNSWVTILSDAVGMGSATVRYAVTANGSLNNRTGVVVIGGQPFSLTQRGIACVVSLAPAMRNHGYGAASNGLSVTINAGCTWAASTTNSWITLVTGLSGTGNGSAGYLVAANPNSMPRAGAILVNDETFPITQDGASCTYDLAPGARTHGYAATTNTVALASVVGCPWNVVNTNGWIILLSPASGTGSATITYRVTANGSVNDRAGVVVIGGQPFSVTQRGITCTLSLAPAMRNHGWGAASNGLSVTASAGCAWAATTTNNWITLVTGLTGSGNGSVGYRVTANPSSLPRAGAVVLNDVLFPITQDGAPCVGNYDLLPGDRTHGYAATTNTVALTAVPGCSWSVVNTNGWIILLSPASGTGSATITYRVTANGSINDRAGIVVIGGQPFSVTQRGISCTLSLAPDSRSHGWGAASNGLSVTASAGCAWAAATTNNWITLFTGLTGTGSGSVGYLVTANPSSLPRAGAIVVNDQVFPITQDGTPCAYDLSPGDRTHGHAATTNSVVLTAVPGCSWSVINTNGWVTILSDAAGTGSATVRYAVAANPSVNDRAGVLLIGGQPFVLTQRGITCSVSLAPASRNHGYGAATNTVTVTTSAACAWAASTTNSWIILVSSATGAGNGSASYRVTDNPSSLPRSGAVVVNDEIFPLTQDGAPCVYDLSPDTRMHGHGAATNTITLSAPGGCPWNVVNTNGWVTILSDTAGTGNATVTYKVATNANPATRAGVVLIGGQPINLTQQGSACTVSISPMTRNHGHGAASNHVTISAGAGCAWVVSTTNSWLTLVTAASGTGSGSVSYLAAANPSSLPRAGALVVADEVLALTQNGIPCTFTIAPGDRTHGYAATTNTMSLTAPQGCVWAVINTNNWVTILSDAAGAGNATVRYAVTANGSVSDRTGVVLIGGQPFNLTQQGTSCALSLAPAMRNHGYGAASNGLSVTANAGCAWTASTTNSWLTLVTGLTGAGNGSVGYRATANPSSLPRAGAVMVNDEMFPLTQDGAPCSYSLTPGSRIHGYGAATNTIAVAAPDGCPWNVLNTNSWIMILSAASGNGNATVTYKIEANPAISERTGTVMIDSQVFLVTQAGINCTYKISPTTRTHGFAATSGIVTVTAGSNCAWSVVNTNDWLMITSGATGIGNGSIGYNVAPNLTNVARMGFVTVADQVLALTQRGATNGFIFETIAVLDGGPVRVRMAGAPAGVWELQVSSDLQVWTRLTDVTNVTGVIEFTDPTAIFSNHRFYRAVQP